MTNANDRREHTPTTLYLNGRRLVSDYTAEDAVRDYMYMHPDADEVAVRAEVERVGDDTRTPDRS